MAQSIKYEYLLFAFFVGFLLHCALKSRNNLEGMGVCVDSESQDYSQSCRRIEYPSEDDANCGEDCAWKDCGEDGNLPKGCKNPLNSENNDCIDQYFISDANAEMQAHASLYPGDITSHFSDDSDNYVANALKWGQGACGAPKPGWYINENQHIPYPCKKQPGCDSADYTGADDEMNRCNNLAESILSKDFYKCDTQAAGESMDHNGVISDIACQSQDHCETASRDNACIDVDGTSYRKCKSDGASDGYYSDSDGRVRQCTPIENPLSTATIQCTSATDTTFVEGTRTKDDDSAGSDPSIYCDSGYELKTPSDPDNSGDSDICVEKDGFPWWGWLLIILGVLVVIVAILYKTGALSKRPAS